MILCSFSHYKAPGLKGPRVNTSNTYVSIYLRQFWTVYDCKTDLRYKYKILVISYIDINIILNFLQSTFKLTEELKIKAFNYISIYYLRVVVLSEGYCLLHVAIMQIDTISNETSI